MRVLILESDLTLSGKLSDELVKNGYIVDVALDGKEGYELGKLEIADVVILALNLPNMDGLSILKSWRESGCIFPVLVLTAKDKWSEKVEGIEAGADDYLTKPFHTEELLVRVKAILRRVDDWKLTNSVEVQNSINNVSSSLTILHKKLLKSNRVGSKYSPISEIQKKQLIALLESMLSALKAPAVKQKDTVMMFKWLGKILKKGSENGLEEGVSEAMSNAIDSGQVLMSTLAKQTSFTSLDKFL